MFTGYKLRDSYVFEKVIGSGGMGEVWSAIRTTLGDRVAIKVLKLTSFQDKDKTREQLKKEAKITSMLNHPNVCKVFDFIEQDDVCFLVMELLEGIDLQALLRNTYLLNSVDRSGLAIYISKEVLRALDTAHNIKHSTIARILHRDIKPANIFLTKHGEIKLLDLGVAKIETNFECTKSSDTFCSRYYSSPELWEKRQYNVDKYSARNDIYSLGLVFYEIIVGEKAFHGNETELFEKLEKGEVPSLKSFTESEEIDNIFNKWTHKTPTERFESASSLLVIMADLSLDHQINESVIVDIFKRSEKPTLFNLDSTACTNVIGVNKNIFSKSIHFSNEQKKILEWKFGGTKRISGLAGTGKSLLLAKKIIKDIMETNCSSFLYLTHNKNLILKFQDYLFSYFAEEGIKVVNTSEKKSPIRLECKINGRAVTLLLCTFDAFPTSCVSHSMDESLFNAKSNGPLWKIFCNIKDNNSIGEVFKKTREAFISKLGPLQEGKEELFGKFDALYIDEFQDCRIDPSRLLLSILFVKKNDRGEANLCFTEDLLQSFVKHEFLQDFDESYENIHKKDLASNAKLGLPDMRGKSKILDTIYRTPEKIFKASLNLLENQGGLLKNRKKEIGDLKYKNHIGCLTCIDQIELKKSISLMLKDKNHYLDDIILIESLDNQKISSVFNELSKAFACNVVDTQTPPKLKKINFFHEYNVRGLESKVVYLIIGGDIISKPNYIYTLMCRAKVELVLVRSDSVSIEEFQQFVDLLSVKELKVA